MVLQQWVAHRGDGVEDLALSPDSRRLVSAGGEAPVVWAIDHDVQKVAELEGHTRAVLACDWSPNGELIASGSDDGTVRVWDSATYQQRDLALSPAHGEPYDPGQYTTYTLFELHFSPDSRHLAWIFHHEYCRVWKPLKGDQPITLQGTNWSRRYTYALSFDPEGRRIATTHGMVDRDNRDKDYPEECMVQIWDVATGAALTVLSGYLEAVKDPISFSPDGKFKTVLSCSPGDPKPFRVWDARSGEQLGWLQGSGEAACYSPDGKYIASGMEGGVEVRRTDDLQGPCVAEFTEHSYGVSHIAFSPNGKFLVSAEWLGIVHIRPLFQVHDIGH